MKKFAERTRLHRVVGMSDFVRQKPFRLLVLVDLIGFRTEDDSVAIKRNTDLAGFNVLDAFLLIASSV